MTAADFLEAALTQIGTPYIWGGKVPKAGLDCSGLVTHALYASGGLDWRNTHNTDVLWKKLAPIQHPRAGDLAFYGGSHDGDVDHVMIVLPLDEGNPDLVLGACGGDSTTTTLREAFRRKACVQVKQGVHYRPDFRGYRQLPIP